MLITKFIWHLHRFLVKVLMSPYRLMNGGIDAPPITAEASTRAPNQLNFLFILSSLASRAIEMSWKLTIWLPSDPSKSFSFGAKSMG